ncbi:UDP-N-acetylmuramoyl-tripeptide--D-alanyl-D-alanine ligase [Brachybacterium sp. EF45031]|uniref:UDP-N-acetylmuramoyl-tripeptide--D-alanyl-D- alanine ligase n=1 Tax=Brachybacterium sillae TaxID=2810536 RepID=UPI00217CD11E|nr:UDP-N-acetylmuramoyl-tripeptide--D-alanyl-D-alanine ligase [Brachybacterium sillae]MCS6712399.1 UDP-N-acetylmuramoyl-tripeptide--D-alanyl-D-alanine ligase [Brachybacterium sillae]
MLTMTAQEVAATTGGRLVGGATGQERVTGRAVVDSRQVATGDLFAAFDGEHVDGHDYAQRAVDAGAALVLLTRDVGVPGVLVEDAEVALADLARGQLERARASCPELVVVAVTGSAGKTGTKDLLGQLFERLRPTIAPPGSHNNELGLPLTVLGLTEETRCLVLEMGARGIGHIRYLTDIARPDIALVLNVGSAHLGEFGSPEAIAQAKGEIIEALTSQGRAVLNADDPRVAAMAPRTSAPVVTWGQGPADVRVHDLTLDEAARARFTLVIPEGLTRLDGGAIPAGELPITLRLLGEHQAFNAVAAATAALLAGVGPEDVAEVLRTAEPLSGQRMETHELPGGITVVNDAYNANPESMRLALRTLAHLGRHRRTIAVLGEMRELGADSIRLHDETGRLVVRLNIDHLIAVGEGARPIHQGAGLEGSFGGESEYVATVEEALAVLQRFVRPGDVVLLKSSRDSGLRELGDRLVQALQADTTRDTTEETEDRTA